MRPSIHPTAPLGAGRPGGRPFVIATVVLAVSGLAGPAFAAPCAPSTPPHDVLLRVTRHLMPIDPHGESRQVGAIRADGPCDAAKLCRRVSAATIAALYPRVLVALQARHRSGSDSPHYPGRWITVEIGAAACEVGDTAGPDGRIADADMPAFDAAFDAINTAFVAAAPRWRLCFG